MAQAAGWPITGIPAKDEAAGEQCKSYGAPGLMRVPGRLHITWPDENTIKVEMDAGTQTRIFHFNANHRRTKSLLSRAIRLPLGMARLPDAELADRCAPVR